MAAFPAGLPAQSRSLINNNLSLCASASPPHPVNDSWAARVQVVHSRRDVAQHVQTLAPGQLAARACIALESTLRGVWVKGVEGERGSKVWTMCLLLNARRTSSTNGSDQIRSDPVVCSGKLL